MDVADIPGAPDWLTEHLRATGIEFGNLGNHAHEHVIFAFLALGEDGLAGVPLAFEGVTLGDTLEHADTGVPVVLDSLVRWSDNPWLGCRGSGFEKTGDGRAQVSLSAETNRSRMRRW